MFLSKLAQEQIARDAKLGEIYLRAAQLRGQEAVGSEMPDYRLQWQREVGLSLWPEVARFERHSLAQAMREARGE